MKKYAIIGTGGRARNFYESLVNDFKGRAELVAFCDINQTRMDFSNHILREQHDHPGVPTYRSHQFDDMIKEQRPDVVIVTTIDRTHHRYIIRAMEMGCDVITEKPMTVDAEKCQAIVDAVHRTGRQVKVAFNYRYAPHNTKIREIIMDGVIGEVYSIHFQWMLNTKHGGDYFRRWHRDKRNSGGLLVHKATHHFDLVNFWLGSEPKTVMAMGDLRFYGRENAEERGVTAFYQRSHGSEAAMSDPFGLDMASNPTLKAMYLDAEHEDGYQRDQSVFGDGISIEDTMALLVRYKNKAILNYSLNAYAPWEGFMISFNGSKGRLEVKLNEQTYVNAGGSKELEGAVETKELMVFPMFGRPYEVEVENLKGGHGGGDPLLMEDLIGEPREDRFKRAASHVDGAKSILIGIAGNISMQTGLPVELDRLVKL
ncbi:Gfo/Idh/MocA family oxidoreductase [Paenibacillus sp. J5C_2022]|uniref:Gfo/Idh/MocA family protein n=1 Tax=Paenibacillus sp. J5C2022 TaxID=2977129 RepID=UPI0021D17BCB|nr:Gfo/Idh/MocA family oxidoreductase [Paenibacillus sp. J5C2022]MCU6712755.1 Gfo/Idh/MocA family oxidoreductase [Paenibacillus sp. J5C2022]